MPGGIIMSSFQSKFASKKRLDNLVKIGLIRELFQRNQITQAQFEQLMKLQRA